MRKHIIFLYLPLWLIIIFLNSSCHRSAEGIRALLRDSEALLENDPEAAYGMLDSLDINTIRPRSLRAEAALLYTKAQYQSYQEIRSDSVIGLAVSYYQGKDRQRSHWSESLMYKGALNYELGNLETAIESYKEAAGILEPYAETREDYITLGLIYTRMAESLSGNFMDFRETLDNHLTALKYFREAGDTARQLNLLLNVGRDYYRNDKDSTLFYLRQAVELAEDCADYETLCNSLFYIYNIYMVRGEYGRILEDYESRRKAGMPRDYEYHILPVLTETYIRLGDTRSALDCYRSYMEFPSFCRDSIDELSLNVEISLMQKDYEKAYYALYAQQDYLVRSLDQAIKDQGLALTRRYDYSRYREANLALELRNMSLLSTGLILLLVLITVIYYIRVRYNRVRRRNLEIALRQRELESSYRLMQQVAGVIPETLGIVWERLSSDESRDRVVLMKDYRQIEKEVYRHIKNRVNKYLSDPAVRRQLASRGLEDQTDMRKAIYILWQSGCDLSVIADIFGTTKDSVRVTLSKIRELTD